MNLQSSQYTVWKLPKNSFHFLFKKFREISEISTKLSPECYFHEFSSSESKIPFLHTVQ